MVTRPTPASKPTAASGVQAAPASRRRRSSWVPIRSLNPRHLPRILRHLLALDPADRYLRFGYAASDAQIERYVDSLDFTRHDVIGVFDRRLELTAVAHLAGACEVTGAPSVAEFGVSVTPRARGRGLGAHLFERAVLLARNRGIDTLLIDALSENHAMLAIARKAGATVERSGPESQARLRLPPHNMASQVGALLERGAADIDYRFKMQMRQARRWLDTLAEVKARLSRAGGTAGS